MDIIFLTHFIKKVGLNHGQEKEVRWQEQKGWECRERAMLVLRSLRSERQGQGRNETSNDGRL